MARPWLKRLLWACLAAAGGTLAVEAGITLVGPNFHEVVPGKVYRCAQPTPERIESAVRNYGIRTLLNLRGCCETEPWYLNECGATARLNVSQEDIALSAGHLPPSEELRRLVEVFDKAEPPILMHCFRGIDRTGLASTVARLLMTDDTLDEALGQLSLRYAHLRWGRTGSLDEFFELYREWLHLTGRTHTPDHFRLWATREYCPGACRAEIVLAAPVAGPLTFPAGKPVGVRVICRNTSVRSWQLGPNPNAGIHLLWKLCHPSTMESLIGGRAGLFEADVPPGQGVAVTIALPALGPGRYVLRVEMLEAQHCRFSETGTLPVDWEVVVK